MEISTAVNGLDLADASFGKFWAKADELGCGVAELSEAERAMILGGNAMQILGALQ